MAVLCSLTFCQKGYYFIKATVITGRNSAKTERRVRIDRNAMACSAHLINRGLSIAAGGRATAEFAGVGPVDSFRCTLNGETLSDPCKYTYTCILFCELFYT